VEIMVSYLTYLLTYNVSLCSLSVSIVYYSVLLLFYLCCLFGVGLLDTNEQLYKLQEHLIEVQNSRQPLDRLTPNPNLDL